jgi:hypothetical protein
MPWGVPLGCSGLPCYTHCMRMVVGLAFCCVSSLFDIGLVGFLAGSLGAKWRVWRAVEFLCLVLSCLVFDDLPRFETRCEENQVELVD